MNPADLKKQAEEIEQELDRLEEEPEKPRYFMKIILGLFLVLIIILWVVPYYGVSSNPEPKTVPPLTDINFIISENNSRLSSINEAILLDTSPEIRQSTIRIASQACPESEICYAKAIYYYVKDNIQYIEDPAYEYIQSPEETLLGAGDCEDKAILIYAMMRSIGIRATIITIPGHAYNEIYIYDAPKRYTQKNGWIVLDTTCRTCDFGELPLQNLNKKKDVIG